MTRVLLAGFFLLYLGLGMLWAQTDQEQPPNEQTFDDIVMEDDIPFSAGLSLGLGHTGLPSRVDGSMDGWQTLSFMPEFMVGSVFMRLDLELRARFDAASNQSPFTVRSEDWIPDETRSFADLYASKIHTIRLGSRTDDYNVFYGNLAPITLGNGFIVQNYTNDLHAPEFYVSGLEFNMDGNTFKFPWIGIETFMGNFARWDLLGLRIHAKPVSTESSSLISEMQLGLTVITDGNPHAFNPDPAIQINASNARALMWGVDFRQPIVATKNFSLGFFGDLANQLGSLGGQLGIQGSHDQVIQYRLALRFIGEHFTPAYVDEMYDILRSERFGIFSGTTDSPAYNGWLLGTSLSSPDKAISFSTTLDGSIPGAPGMATRLRSSLALQDIFNGILDLKVVYNKENLASLQDFLEPEWTYVGFDSSVTLGPSTVSLSYQLRYDPFSSTLGADGSIQKWKTSGQLNTTINVISAGGTE